MLHAYYQSLAAMARKDQRVTDSHSVEEALGRHHEKLAASRSRRTHHQRR